MTKKEILLFLATTSVLVFGVYQLAMAGTQVTLIVGSATAGHMSVPVGSIYPTSTTGMAVYTAVATGVIGSMNLDQAPGGNGANAGRFILYNSSGVLLSKSLYGNGAAYNGGLVHWSCNQTLTSGQTYYMQFENNATSVDAMNIPTDSTGHWAAAIWSDTDFVPPNQCPTASSTPTATRRRVIQIQ